MSHHEEARVVTASREIAAAHDTIFELIADPAQQPRWDGNDNLAEAPTGQRVRRTGDVFTMSLTKGSVRENHVVEFDEGLRIAWQPAEPGRRPPGHVWRWGARSRRHRPHTGHAHLRLDPVDRRTTPAACARHHGREVAGLDRPARRPRRASLRSTSPVGGHRGRSRTVGRGRRPVGPCGWCAA